MKLLVQRVRKAAVEVNNQVVGKIEKGLLLFLGVEKEDTQAQADFLAKKVANLRIFEDEEEKMNLSIAEVSGQFLVISQFTLAGDTSHGNRPGFGTAAHPDVAKPLYEYFVQQLRQLGHHVETGIFQADMQVSLINDGPCTFILQK